VRYNTIKELQAYVDDKFAEHDVTYGGLPYSTHLDEVRAELTRFGWDEDHFLFLHGAAFLFAPPYNPSFAALGRIRKQLVPALLVASYPAAARLMRLPYSEQKRAMEDGIEVLLMDSDGPDTLTVKPENLTNDQARQVFNGNSIRTLPAQRSFIESNREKERAALVEDCQATYRISGNKAVILSPCTLTAKDLVRILNEIQ
jgi:hypothetical protein